MFPDAEVFFQPDLADALPLMSAVCPNPDDHVYLDVLALENPDERVEEVIRDFYETKTDIPDSVRPLFLRSPFHVSWHTDSAGLDYRLVVIDNRHVASLYQSLSRFRPR